MSALAAGESDMLVAPTVTVRLLARCNSSVVIRGPSVVTSRLVASKEADRSSVVVEGAQVGLALSCGIHDSFGHKLCRRSGRCPSSPSSCKAHSRRVR